MSGGGSQARHSSDLSHTSGMGPGLSPPSDPGEEGEGLTMATPNWAQLDEMGKMTQESQDTCVTLSDQIKAAMTEVRSKLCCTAGRT